MSELPKPSPLWGGLGGGALGGIAVRAFATALLAGCSLTPHLDRPSAPVPAIFPSYAPPPQAPAASVLGYARVFGDPRLIALLDRALATNRDLAAFAARAAEARAQYGVTRANQFPTLTTSAGVAADRSSGAGRGGSATALDYGVYTANLGVTAFELDFWGRVRSLSHAALARYLASEQGRRAFQLSLISQTANAYFTERDLTERIGLATQAIASRREALRIAKLRLDAGVASALDYRQVEVLLRQAETEATILANSRAQQQNLLLTLTGGPPSPPGSTPLPEPLPIFGAGEVAEIAPGLPSSLLTARPDIAQAEQILIAANANIGAARAAFFPQISLTTALGFASGGLTRLFGADGFTYSVGPSAVLPIFDFGRTRGNLRLAQATRDEAIATYQRTIQTAFQEVANGLAGRRYLAEQLQAEQLTAAAQRDRARLATLRYRNGVANYLEVLDAERDLFTAEQAVVDVRGQQLVNAAQLYVALGGGLTR